jgi:phosphatidylserine/phosphatidylglycerophosphate/cardiolipin synthase-like enzyme
MKCRYTPTDTVHAKVFIVGGTAYVGSANLSQRATLADTAEAAIQTTDSELVRQARDFVHRLAHDAIEVDELWLEWADAVPVHAGGSLLWNPDPPFLPHEPYDVWIGPEEKVDWTEEERSLVASGRSIHWAAAR